MIQKNGNLSLTLLGNGVLDLDEVEEKSDPDPIKLYLIITDILSG